MLRSSSTRSDRKKMPRTPWRRRLLRWEVFLALVVAADFALNVQLSPYFLSAETLADVSFNFTEKALVALPMTLLIIDLHTPTAEAKSGERD